MNDLGKYNEENTLISSNIYKLTMPVSQEETIKNT